MTADLKSSTESEVPAHVILIIDDDHTSLDIVSGYLEERGYTVLVAEDGESGVKRAEYARPGLILLDIMMPGVDGYETCRRLKERESTKDIPVIFMTALADTEHKVRGFEAGAVDYVTKPVQREEVLARAGVHLRIRELTIRLQHVNESLEQRVEERTAELRESNDKLALELAERMRAEKALHESRQLLDSIVANSPGAIYRCANDSEWTMEFLSAAITRITGYPAGDFLNNCVRSYASIIHPGDRRSVRDAVEAALQRKKRYEVDYRLAAADGALHWVHEQGRGVFSPDGQLLCLDGVIFDITAHRQAEDEIRKLNEELEQRVQERTVELKEKNAELEQMNKIFVGRELKMVELKNRIRELEEKLSL